MSACIKYVAARFCSVRLWSQHLLRIGVEIERKLAMALPRAIVFHALVLLLVVGAAAQAPDEGYSREQLQPLTKFRFV